MGLLKTSHVRLSSDEDLLLWNQSKSGKYTPRSGYLQLLMDRQEGTVLVVEGPVEVQMST